MKQVVGRIGSAPEGDLGRSAAALGWGTLSSAGQSDPGAARA